MELLQQLLLYSTVSTGIFFFPFLFYLEGVPYPILQREFNKSPATYFCSRKLSVSSFRWSRRFSVFLLVFSVGLSVGVEPHRPRLGSPLLILPIIKRKFYLPHGLRSAWRQPLLLCLVQSQFQRITLVPPHIVMCCAWNKKRAEIKEGAAGQREKKKSKEKDGRRGIEEENKMEEAKSWCKMPSITFAGKGILLGPFVCDYSIY